MPSPKRPANPDAPEKPKSLQTDAGLEVDDLNTKIAKDFETGLKANEKQKKDLYQDWKRNVELRMGRTGPRSSLAYDNSSDDDYQSELNPDWFLTKTKIANLYSRTPEVVGTHETKQYGPAIAPFMKQLNYEIGDKRAKVGVAMRETAADIVNAAGVGFVFVDYVARFEDVEVPSVDVSMIDPRLV